METCKTAARCVQPCVLDRCELMFVDLLFKLIIYTCTVQSNTRFEAAKNAMLSSLPVTTTDEGREFALSEFYGRWIIQEEERSKAYNERWSKQNWSTIWLGARYCFDTVWSRITGKS